MACKPARSHYVGQGPPGKRQKQFARSSGNNQFSIAQLKQTLFAFREQHTRLRLVKNSRPAEFLDTGSAKPANPPGRFRSLGRVSLDRVASPDLPAGRRIVVNDTDRRAAFSRANSG